MTAPRLQERVRAPAELAQCAQWVAWRFVTRRTRRGDTRQDKVPFNVASGRAASHSTPADWTSYAAATQACGYAGVGFVFSPDDPYAGVDLDGCRDPETGITAPWAQQIIDDAQTYAEISPSGTGVKLFGRGTLARSLSKKWVIISGLKPMTVRAISASPASISLARRTRSATSKRRSTNSHASVRRQRLHRARSSRSPSAALLRVGRTLHAATRAR